MSAPSTQPEGHYLQGVPDKDIQTIISKCWTDAAFRRFVLDHPVDALRSEGIDIPPGVRVKAIESTAAVMHLVIPVPPASAR
jgi:hypothetical protein